MTSGMLQPQEPIQASSSAVGPRFRPFASSSHQVTKGRYITSNDPRGYIPVYEYPLNGQWIMMDIDDGYILWTGIWKALGNSKADIVKMIDSQPDLASLIRRVRGGYLKIQGTWMPYEVALRLARRVAWPIRHDLIPLFGPTFPSTCLSPDQPGYGQVVVSSTGRRRTRRTNNATSSSGIPHETQANWTIVTPTSGSNPLQSPHHLVHSPTAAIPLGRPPSDPTRSQPSGQHYADYSSPVSPALSTVEGGPPRERYHNRYSPYSPPSRRPPNSGRSNLSLDIPSLNVRDGPLSPASRQFSDLAAEGRRVALPPIRQQRSPHESQHPYALPPISALEDLRGVNANDSAAVLKRLRDEDNLPPLGPPPVAYNVPAQSRQRSLSVPPSKPRLPELSKSWSNGARSAQSPRSPCHYTPASTTGSAETSPRSYPGQRLPSSATSHASSSTSNPSPISPSPVTPHSAASPRGPSFNLVSVHGKGEYGRPPVPRSYTSPGAAPHALSTLCSPAWSNDTGPLVSEISASAYRPNSSGPVRHSISRPW